MSNTIKRKIGRKSGEIIPLTYDYMFTTILNNPDNIILLENFISCYLDIELSKIKGNLSINRREIPITSKKEKSKQVDLVLKMKDDLINIEMNNSFSESIRERNVLYGCAIHGRQLDYSENDYNKIHNFLQINFDNQNKRTKQFIESYLMMDEKTKDILSKKFRIDVIHMHFSLEACYNEREKKLIRWCQAFQAKTSDELNKVLEENLMEEEAKEKIIEEIDKYSKDEEVYALYTKYSKEEMELNSVRNDIKREALAEGLKKGIKQGIKKGIEQGIKQGIEQGMEKGKENTQLEIINYNIDLGKTKKEIAAFLNISLEQLEDLIHKR